MIIYMVSQHWASALKRYHRADPVVGETMEIDLGPDSKAACGRRTPAVVLKDNGNQTWKVRVEVPARQRTHACRPRFNFICKHPAQNDSSKQRPDSCT